MEFILWLKAQYAELSQLNPVAAGVVLAGIMGAFYATLRNTPKAIWEFVIRQSTTSLTFNNAPGWYGDRKHFTGFNRWFMFHPWGRHARSLSLESNSGKTILGPGFGLHFFFHKGHLYWFNKEALQSQGSEAEKERITLYTWGRDHERLKRMISEFVPKDDDTRCRVWTWTGQNGWAVLCDVPRRELSTVILERNAKQLLINTLEEFFGDKAWYRSRGLSYKNTYVLHGQPGTGKSSTIKALASHYRKNICLINVDSIDNAGFAQAMASLPDNSFVLIEDFDSNSAFKARKSQKSKSLQPDAKKPVANAPAALSPMEAMFSDDFSRLSLSSVLNTMDGVVGLDDVVVFMTTNHLENIDPAILRAGRVDHIIEVPKLTDVEIREYILLMFPEWDFNNRWVVFEDIAGCDLEKLFKASKRDVHAFVDSIPVRGVPVTLAVPDLGEVLALPVR